MLLTCAACGARYLNEPAISVSPEAGPYCPSCRKLSVRPVGENSSLNFVIAHEDAVVGNQLRHALSSFPVETNICRSTEDVLQLLQQKRPCLVLLDVAFCGGFPFELIDQARGGQAGAGHKIILLPSIYNKTAYKKRPTSLYGADAYLELHHISDRLPGLIKEMYPRLSEVNTSPDWGAPAGGERPLVVPSPEDRALSSVVYWLPILLYTMMAC